MFTLHIFQTFEDSSLYIVASIHLCNTRGLVPVSYDVIKYYKGSSVSVFKHGILRYYFLYDIDMYLFQVLPLLPWNSEFSKIKIVMYFGHRFPLTSHNRVNLLSTKLALLHPSADIHHVGTQKDN